MINIVLVYDDEDLDPDNGSLGHFFQACALHAKGFLAIDDRFTLIDIPSHSLKNGTFDQELNRVQGQHFIFIAYSHGLPDSLICDNQRIVYLSIQHNIHLLKNSLFYTWACSCGLQLGPKAIDEGCRAFIGYNKLVFAGSLYINIFVECANFGLFDFLTGITIEEAFVRMKNKYIEKIDELANIDYWVSSYLERNKNALTRFYSNPSLTIEDF